MTTAGTARIIDQRVRTLGDTLASLAARVDTLETGARGTRLGDSSLENGYISIYDDAGVVRSVVGRQDDGTFVGGISLNNPLPPPVPQVPTLTSTLAGFKVAATAGSMTGSWPRDFDHLNIYARQQGIGNPSVLIGTLANDTDVFVFAPAPPGSTFDVWLTSTNLSGMESTASNAASVSPGQVVPGEILAGAITELELAAGSVTEAILAAGSVTATIIATDAVTTPHIVAGAVQTLQLAADAVAAGKVAADAITGREILALSITSAELSANSVTATQITAGSVTAAALQADLVLASRVIAGNPTGSRVELHPTAGFQGYYNDVRTLWFDNSTGNLTAQGQWATAPSGTRIVLNPGGLLPDTIRFWPGSGGHYASIDAFDAGGGHAGIYLYGSATDNDPSVSRGMLIARRDFASLVNGRPNLTLWGSEVWVEPQFTRNKSAVVDLIIDGRLADPGGGRRVACVRWSTAGVTEAGTILQYTPTQFNGGEPTWHAVGQDVGMVFAPGRIYVRGNGNLTFRPIAASAFEVNSGVAAKEDVTEIATLPGQRSSWDLIEGAPAQDFAYLAEDPGRRPARPAHLDGKAAVGTRPLPGGEPWERETFEADWEWDPPARRTHRFPVAEDLVELAPNLVRPTTGDPADTVVDLRDAVGLLWDAVDMLIKRGRVLENTLPPPIRTALPPRPQRGDVTGGVGVVVPGRTVRDLDPATGQVRGRPQQAAPPAPGPP